MHVIRHAISEQLSREVVVTNRLATSDGLASVPQIVTALKDQTRQRTKPRPDARRIQYVTCLLERNKKQSITTLHIETNIPFTGYKEI